MKMELEAFKEAEVLTNPGVFGLNDIPISLQNNFGDLAPKRQWRSPRKISAYLSDVTRKK
jgi:hypothetical protein